MAFALGLAWAPSAGAESWTRCKLSYELSGWAFLYQQLRGDGRLSCENGQAANVEIVAHGGGFSFGSFSNLSGKGSSSSVHDIRELYGVYGGVGTHAGAGGAVGARVMTKGSANLSAVARGRGVNLGFAFGSFRIRPR